MQNILYRSVGLFLSFCILFTQNSLAQLANVTYSVQVSRVISYENPTSGACWETGDEEYSAFVRAWDNVNATQSSSGCLTCDANGDCTYGVGVLLNTRTNNSTNIFSSIDAWEDDRGDRCTFDGPCFLCNADDCRRQQTENYNFRAQAPPSNGSFTDGPTWGSTADHQWIVRATWRYSGTTNLITPTCTPQTAAYTSGNIRSWSVNLIAGVTYNFSTCGGSTEDTYMRIFGTDGHTQAAFNDDDCGLQSNLNFTPVTSGTHYVELSRFSRAALTANGTLAYSIAAPTTSLNGGNITACPNVASAALGGVVPSSGTGTWTSSNPTVTFNNPSAPNTTAVGTTPGTYTLTWTINNGGCTSASNLQISIISNSIAPTAITGTTNICQGDNTTLTVTGGSAGTGATAAWYSGSCGGTAVGAGNSVTVSPAATSTYFVRYEGTCNNTTCAAVTVNVLPAANASAIDTDVCPGNSATLVASGAGAVSYNWYASLVSLTPLQSGSSVFTTPPITIPIAYYVSAINAGGCEGPRSAVNVGVLLAPAPTTSGATTICSGENTVLSATAAGASGFNWYQNSDKTGFLQSGASFTTLPLNFSTIFYVAASYANGCESLLTPTTVTVNQLPPAPVANGGNYCDNENVIVTAFGTGGTINWYSASTGGTLLFSGSTYNAGLQTAGNYIFYAEEDNGSCRSLRTAVLAVVNPAPTSPVVTSAVICAGEQASLVATPTTGTIQWYSNPAMTNLLATGSSYITTILTVNTSYYVVEVSNTGCRSMASVSNVTVNPVPAAPVGTDATVCAGETATLTATGGAGTLTWYADAGTSVSLATGGSFTTPILNATTTYYVQEESVDGCLSSVITVTATVNQLPNAPAGNANSVCEGNDVILNGFGSGGTLSWFNVATGGTALGTGASYNAGALTAGSYTFYVSENNGSCNSARTPVSAVVNVVPAAPTASAASICSGESAILTATGTGAIQWYADAALTTLLSTGSTFTTPNLAIATTYHVALANSNGCISSATAVTVNINPVPAAPVATAATVCAGETATLTATGGAGTLTWYADAGTSVSLATGGSFTTPVLNATTTYYVQEESVVGCLSPLTAVTATVNQLPTAPAGNANSVCEGNDVILNGFGSGGTLSWFNVATGGTALGTGASYNAGALTAGSYTFYVSENNGSCNSARTPVSAVVNVVPAAPTASATSICSGESAILTATGTGAIQWYADAALTTLLSTGSTFTTPNLIIATTYHVALANSNGCISSATAVTVNINPVPAAPTATGVTVCSGQSAALSATGTGGTLEWFADASASLVLGTGSTFTTNPLTQTTAYFVRETSAQGCISSLTPVIATVSALPIAPAAAAVTTCAGAAVTLSATGSGTGDIVFYNASFVEIGRVTMSVAVPNATFNVGVLAAANYIFYVAEDNGTCISSFTGIAVEVLTAPAAPTALNDGPACEGAVLFLQASTIPGATYSWAGPNGFSSTMQTAMISNLSSLEAGIYTVSAFVNGCPSSSASTTVIVNALPLITGGITNNGPLCEGEDLLLNAPTISNVTYDWTGPNGFSSNAAIAGIVNVNEFDHQGFYTLVVTDVNGCESLPLSTLVEVNTLPQAGMIFSNGPLCEGSTLNLSVLQVFGATYSWSGPNGFTSNDRTPSIANVTFAEAGIYTVTVSKNNCSTELDISVLVDTIPNTFVVADTTVEVGAELVLFAGGGVIYQWSPATYLSTPNAPTTYFGGAPVGTYTISVLIQDAEGCAVEEKVNVTVEPATGLIVTDLFTPNGDGVNETWVIQFLDNVGPYTLQVFTRGGLEVLNSQNYVNDWDGTHYKSGKKLPEGTYYYIIRTDTKQYTGAVTIKR